MQTEPIVGNVGLDDQITALAVKQIWSRSPPPLEALILALGLSLAFRIGSSEEAASDGRFAVQSKGYPYALGGHVSAE